MEVQHTKPAWRHKADYVIGIKITDPVWSKRYESEQLAAREIGDGTFEICCIPFMTYDLFLGDVVSVSDDLEVNSVVRPSGHFGFRVATSGVEQQDWIVEEMQGLGQLSERYSDKICAIDAEDERTARDVSTFLGNAVREGHILEYETIKT